MKFWRYALGLLLALRPQTAERHDIQQQFVERTVVIDGTTHHYRVFVPVAWSKTQQWPVTLFLHGGGGYGNDNARQLSEGLAPAIQRHPERFPVLAVFPQSPANGTPGWQQIGGRIAMAALEQTIAEFNADTTRISLSGLSIGGNGAWHLAFHYPTRFAALLVVCGFVDERMGTMYPILYPAIVPNVSNTSAAVAERIAHIPTWVFHGSDDQTVPVEHSRRMVAALRGLAAPVRYVELPGVDHNAWDYAFEQPDVARFLVLPTAADNRVPPP